MISSFVRRQYGWMSAGLFRKYVFIISSLVVGALLISGGSDIYFTYKDKLNSISDIERGKASIAASNIDFFIGDVQRQLKRAAQVEYEVGDSGIAAREEDYLALINRVPAITELGYWDTVGHEQLMMAQFGRDAFSSNSPLPVEQIMIEAKARGSFNGPVYFDDDFVQHMTMGIAESGTRKGVLIAEVNLSVVQVIIAQLSLADSGWAYVVDANGLIVSHPVEGYVTQKTSVAHLRQVQTAIEAGTEITDRASKLSVSIEKSLDGQSVLATSFPIKNLGWHVLVEQPRSEALASLTSPIIRSVMLLVAGLVVAVITSMILARRMVSPILKLRDAADKLSLGSDSGPDGEHVSLKTGDELESLGQAFNRMSAQIRESYATLETRVEQRTSELARTNANLENEMIEREKAERLAFVLQRAIEHSPSAILITDTNAHIEYINPKFTEVTGYTSEDVVGKTPGVLKSGRTSQEKYGRLWETIRSGSQWEGELYNKRKDGKFYWSSESILPIKNEHGAITHYLAVEQDVTERKKAEEDARIANQRLAEMNRTLEKRVTERTSELQQANDRLIDAHDQLVRTEKLAAIGQLSAGVAHDLRNPLGAIKNAIYYLNGKLNDSESAKENPRIPEFLNIINYEVDHSNKIITDLMDFARIAPPSFAPADLGTLVQDCLGTLGVKEGVYINVLDGHHEDLLQVQVDGEQLNRVFQNLILNAQEAMQDGGVITVSTVENDGFADVSVSDTGEGIKPEIINKIFDPLFTTKTQGTGLGLAVCQQIVSKHGGTIEVESKPGKGSTFRVRLPLSAVEGLSKEAQNASA
ncbi:MAG: PAS domain S-box protein [SAR202 cluster bacterium]|nr:PAS domain S-box protein [SAR202 cluster bacterium]